MITVNEGLDAFLNNYIEAPIYIYGAGHCGDWIGEFMNRCHVDFSGYLDGSSMEGEILNDKPCFRPDKLNDFRGRNVRIIISPGSYKKIRYDFLEMEHRYGVNCICIIPLVTNSKNFFDQDRYDINRFLGYFRRRLLRCKLPMMISNDTSSGDILRMFAESMDGRIPYVGFSNNDFMKICDEPWKFMNKACEDYYVTAAPRMKQGKHICGKIDDLSIHFFRCTNKEDAEAEWEEYRKKYDQDRLLFILSDHNGCITDDEQKHFDHIPYKHITLHRRDRVFSLNGYEGSHFCMDGYFLTKKDLVIENGFDLIGWMNKLYE